MSNVPSEWSVCGIKLYQVADVFNLYSRVIDGCYLTNKKLYKNIYKYEYESTITILNYYLCTYVCRFYD